MCSYCFDSTKYTCLMCINQFCTPSSVFEDDEISRLESTQFVGVLRGMFLREVTKKIYMNLKKNRRQEGTGRALSELNCDASLGMSNNRTQTKFRNHVQLLNANCI